MRHFEVFRRWALALVSLWLVAPLPAQREMRTINDGWEFRLPAEERWTRVNLPHTYNLDAYAGRHYYQGKAYYRRAFALPPAADGRRYYLKLDAASKAARVVLNGAEVGTHAGGYTAFACDVTGHLREDNLLEVEVDNSRQDIAPISADFTFWGGIYRDVWLVSTPEQHFNMANMGSGGVFVSTPEVSEERATVRIRSEVVNDGAKTASLELRHRVYDPQGRLVQAKRLKLRAKAGETVTSDYTSGHILHPALWSPESPNLYEVRTTLVDPKTGRVLDEQVNKVGFRWFAFDGEKGFFLNGKPYKLRGVNRHQDQAPVGVALDDEAHRRDVRLMKEFGCNFVRISHYPQDDALLDACDRLGLLVWEEIPVVNIVEDTPGFADNCEYNLREMIRQHYNHPSVIAWGYMNEILLVTPGPGNPRWPAYKERTVALAQRLEKVLKEEDPARASVMAYNMTNTYHDIGLDLTDVGGWNLYQGWYVDRLEDFNAWCEYQHEHYPQLPIIISEWGAGGDRRLHTLKGHPFDFSIEYHQTYVEHYLPFIEETEWISGCAYWNFIDFNVAARQESMPRVNNKGMFYNDRTPKDVAYYFKAMWRKDMPVVHIATRDWPVRTADPATPQPVKVYTNLPEVELWVNGRSLGRQRAENCHAEFHVVLPEGTSVLLARGVDGGRTAEDATTLSLQALPNLSAGDELAINVGSNCEFTSSVSQLTWLPDQPYVAGSWGYVGGNERSTTSEIELTVDGPLYQTWREGEFTYRIDVPAGDYEVELLMADVTRPAAQLANLLDKATAEAASADARFDVAVCGRLVEADFSPADGGRFRTACRRRYVVKGVESCITVELKAREGKPFLSAVKVRKL